MTIVYFVGRIENVFTGIDNFHNNYSIVVLIIAPLKRSQARGFCAILKSFISKFFQVQEVDI